MSKKKNLNTSIIAEESIDMKPSRKPNVSIEQITIYDWIYAIKSILHHK